MIPIVINAFEGHPTVGAAAQEIHDALSGAAPLTITGAKCTGDTVWLKPRQVWRDDAVTVEHIARTITSPQHGEIAYAYIDTSRLDQAPAIRAIEAANRAAAAEAEARAAEMVPSCDNCGDCPQCC
jgi:hypothetical protein